MQKILSCLILFFLFYRASAQTSPAQVLADKIALKMKDSLSLSEQQRSQLYNINIQLHNLKASARQQYSAMDSLGRAIQRIENTRDSLYSSVLNSEQTILYKEKKSTLISNN
jgi:hypothetical protein